MDKSSQYIFDYYKTDITKQILQEDIKNFELYKLGRKRKNVACIFL